MLNEIIKINSKFDPAKKLLNQIIDREKKWNSLNQKALGNNGRL